VVVRWRRMMNRKRRRPVGGIIAADLEGRLYTRVEEVGEQNEERNRRGRWGGGDV